MSSMAGEGAISVLSARHIAMGERTLRTDIVITKCTAGTKFYPSQLPIKFDSVKLPGLSTVQEIGMLLEKR